MKKNKTSWNAAHKWRGRGSGTAHVTRTPAVSHMCVCAVCASFFHCLRKMRISQLSPQRLIFMRRWVSGRGLVKFPIRHWSKLARIYGAFIKMNFYSLIKDAWAIPLLLLLLLTRCTCAFIAFTTIQAVGLWALMHSTINNICTTTTKMHTRLNRIRTSPIFSV